MNFSVPFDGQDISTWFSAIQFRDISKETAKDGKISKPLLKTFQIYCQRKVYFLIVIYFEIVKSGNFRIHTYTEVEKYFIKEKGICCHRSSIMDQNE